MKRILAILFLFTGIVLFGGEGKDQKEITFQDFVNNINLKKNTSLHVENFWTINKGKSFTWTAKVVNVKGSRGKAEIQAANEKSPLYKGFNLILVTYQKADAANLKIGEQIKFKGTVYNYRNRSGAIIVYVNNVQLLPLEAN